MLLHFQVSYYELWVSYKRGPFRKATFESERKNIRYHIADVSGEQAMVVAVLDPKIAHLYVSVDVTRENVKFALSLENIFCFIPNLTWQNSWIGYDHHFSFVHTFFFLLLL